MITAKRSKSKMSKTSVAMMKRKCIYMMVVDPPADNLCRRVPIFVEKTSLSSRNRFRFFIRKLIQNLYWMTDTTDAPLGNNPDVNAYILSHKRRDKQLISLADKVVLRRPPESRTEEELTSIRNKLVPFKAFRNYSDKVRHDLLQKAIFIYYKPRKVLVRQGQRAMYVYYILSGSVQVEMDVEDSFFTKGNVKTTYELNAGDTFGEIAVLYDEPHTTTYTVGKCDGLEVLVLSANDYKLILETSVQKKWSRVRWAMKKFSCFDKFGEMTLRFFCCGGEILTYRPNNNIPVRDSLNRDISTFIIDGSCRVIQRITVTKSPPSSKVRYVLEKNQDADKVKDGKSIYMQTCLLKRGAVFGLGEGMSKHTVVAVTEVLVLAIPRYVLMKHDVARIWTQAALNMDIWYPSEEEVFKHFLQGRNWSIYKKKLLNNNRNTKRTTDITIHDTPLSVRAREIILCDSLYYRTIHEPDYLFVEINEDERNWTVKPQKSNTRQFSMGRKGFWEREGSERQVHR